MVCPAPACTGTIVLMGGWWSKLWQPFLSEWFLWIWRWRGGFSPHLAPRGLGLARGECGCLASALSGMVAGRRSKLLGALRSLTQNPFLLSKGGGDSLLAQVPFSHTTHLLPGWGGGGKWSWPHYLLILFLSLRPRWSFQSVIICGTKFVLPAMCHRQSLSLVVLNYSCYFHPPMKVVFKTSFSSATLV